VLEVFNGVRWIVQSGKISSEWFFSRALQILNEAPEAYSAADWVVWQLSGVETRDTCTAG